MADWPYSTAAWQRLRQRKIAEFPLCEPCRRRGKLEIASCVDHVIAISAGGHPFPGLDELMSMCQSCHSVKTNARDNPRVSGARRGIAFKGCDVNGLPVDPDHPALGRYTHSKDEPARPPDRSPNEE